MTAGAVDAEYFSNRETMNECRPCTVQNEANCPAGMLPRECTLDQDFTCSLPCVSDTKPLLNSRWLSACKWGCVDGHEAVPTPSGLWFCRPE
jgi:hypothetical protein